MTTEEEHNIDDLVDYKDFESGLESNSDQDSFNDDIMKLYEDHKKKGGCEKTSEVLNSQRPISKYKRNGLSANKKEGELSNDVGEAENEVVNTNNINNTNNVNTFNSENFFIKFNQTLSKFNITKSEFIDNPQIYYSIEEFKEIFKKIKFEITNAELNYLFNFHNSSAKDGYILGETFLRNFTKQIEWGKNSKDTLFKESASFEVKENSYKETLFECPSILRTNTISKCVNEEFKQLKEEVLQIVAKDARPKTTMKGKGRKLLSGVGNAVDNKHNNNNNNNNNNQIANRPMSNMTNNAGKLATNEHTNFSRKKSAGILKPLSATSKSFLKETLQKKKAEDEMIRLAIDRKNKEIERDCIQKMSDANLIAEKLGIPKSFSAHLDEKEKVIVCRVYYKDTQNTEDIDLKKFLMEWKKLVKLMKQRELTKFYKENTPPLEESNRGRESSRGKDNLLSYPRELRQKKIKEVLIDSLELKMKLKKQLKALRDKNLADASVIKANLKLINLDDNNIL